MFLRAEKSQFEYPGPCTTLRPSLPNCSTGEFGSCVRRWKALVWNHCCAVCGPEFGFPIRFGRLLEKPEISGALPCRETSAGSNTVNGVPLIRVTIPLNCQLPSACSYQV